MIAEVCISQWQAGFIDGMACAGFFVLLALACGLGLAVSEIRALEKERHR